MLTFWDALNQTDSFRPLYLPLVLWVSTYLYCKAFGKEFHRFYTLHNIHNFGAILLGLASLYFNDDNIFNERIPILWSLGYFVVDLFDCASRLDFTYSFHAVACLLLGLANYYVPVCRTLRMNSKASLLELSNPLMHLAKRTRNPIHFAMFAAMYTVCRVIWIPVMMWQLYVAGISLKHPIQLALILFYGLNLFWYYKILRIVIEGSKGDTTKKES